VETALLDKFITEPAAAPPAAPVAAAPAKKLSATQLKIQAAKEASAAKLAERDLKAPEVKEGPKAIQQLFEGKDKSDDPFAEANEYRRKRLELEELYPEDMNRRPPKVRPKAKSAVIQQLRIQERASRQLAQENLDRKAMQAEQRAAEKADNSTPSLTKITGIKIPGL
jgi:hypothetical protein